MENKQTIENAIEDAWITYEYEEGNLYSTTFKGGFREGAKWQAERMYSEEEVLTILYFRSMYQDHFESNDEIKEWFDKFKKQDNEYRKTEK